MIYEEILREDSINAKKRNNRNAENFIRHGKSGFNGIRCYGIVSAENPDSIQQSATLNKRGMKSLANAIKSAHYPFVRQKGHFGGNDEFSYFIFNIPLETLMYYSAMFEQTSFIYGRRQENGNVIHEYWEKQDTSQPFDKQRNPYIKKDEEESYVEIDANDNYSIIGRGFKYIIPFSIFESVQHGIMENCRRNNTPYSEQLPIKKTYIFHRSFAKWNEKSNFAEIFVVFLKKANEEIHNSNSLCHSRQWRSGTERHELPI